MKAPHSLDKSSSRVQQMFSKIAGHYDLLNHLLSANQDKGWRRTAIRLLQPRADENILDLCCGTGDFGMECLRQQPQCNVLGADFTEAMLQIAAKKTEKIPFLAADALQLPFENHSFDAVIVGFGVRNFTDTEAGIREIARVLKPSGRFVILEFLRPDRGFVKWGFGVFFNKILPIIGRMISGHRKAYTYLPASVHQFYNEAEMRDLLEKCGLCVECVKNHTGGIASSILCVKNVP